MLTIFGKENCSNCEKLKGILNDKGIEFEYIDSMKELRIAASKARVMSAPVVKVDENYMSMDDYLKGVK